MKKLTLRQRQGIETKLKITRVATELFKTQGFNNVTVRDICESASISVGTFYHHFVSKDEIVNTAHYQIDMLWEERISSYESRNTREDILYMFEEAGALLEELGWDLAAQNYKQLITAKTKYAIQKDRPISGQLDRIIRTGMDRDDFLPGTDPEELTETLLRSSRGVLFDWCLNEGSYNLKEAIRHDLSLILTNFCRPWMQ